MKKFTLLGALWFSLLGYCQLAQPSTTQSLRFEENKGQIVDTDGNLRNDILFTAETGGVKAYLRNSGISYVFANVEHLEAPESSDIKATEAYYKELAEGLDVSYHRVDLQFVGANLNAEIESKDVYESTANYYNGSSEGINNVQSYEVVTYKEIYSNIDLQFHTKDGQMKYDFIVHPGGNPSDIQVDMDGMDKASINGEGQLVLNTSLGTVTEDTPYTFQSNGNEIRSSFSLEGNVLSFNVADYNSTEDLIIDPTLLWATYYGGNSQDDYSKKITTDAAGNLYLVHRTYSTDFPVTAGAYDVTSMNGDVAFSKFTKAGAQVWATYLGGNSNEEAWGVDVDINGDIVISGMTASFDFPTTAGVLSSSRSSNPYYWELFVSKFDDMGALVWSTYLGGSGDEYSPDVETDSNGNVVVVATNFSGTTFPTTPGAFDETQNSFSAITVTKLDGTGNMVWSTILEGNSDEYCRPAVAINSLDDIIVTGSTYSTDFPTTTGAFDEIHNGGGRDWFLTSFSATGAMNWSTFVGGSSDEGYNIDPDVVVDNSDNIYLAGSTNSSDLVTTTGAYDETWNSSWDIYLAKFDNTGAHVWGTYFGGAATDQLGDLDFSNNRIYMVGGTSSTNLPVTPDAHQATFGGNQDVFVTEWNTDGTLNYSTYYGGIGFENPSYVTCAYGSGQLNVMTDTYESTFPTTTGAFDETFNGSYDMALFSIRFCDLELILDGKTDVLCNDELTGTINTSYVTGTEDPVTFLWDNGATTDDLTNLPAGDYKLVATGGVTGCTMELSSTVTINQPDTIETVITGINPVCFGNQTGSIDLTVSGGVAGYTYAWTGGAITEDVTNLGAGIHTVTITDANGCVFEDELEITQPDDITATFVVTPVDCNGNSTGAIDMTVAGGVPGYSYEWSNAELTQNLSGLAAGSYSVLVSDAIGCVALKAQTVTEPNALAIDFMATDIDCNGNTNGSIDATVTGGVATYSYVWSNAEITEDLATLNADMYTLTSTDANGCIVIDSVEILDAEAIVVTGTTTLETFGSDASIYTSVNGGVAPYTYSWDNGTTFPNAFSLSSGDYTVTVTDANGCTGTATFTVDSQLGVGSSMEDGLSVYPNPFNTSFSINYSGTYTWTVYDVAGKLIERGNSNGQEQINLSNVNGGVYILKVETTEGLNIIRLIKE